MPQTPPFVILDRSVRVYLILVAIPFLLFIAPYVELLLLAFDPDRTCWLEAALRTGQYFYLIELTGIWLIALVVPLTAGGVVYVWFRRMKLRASLWAPVLAGMTTLVFAGTHYITTPMVNAHYQSVYVTASCAAGDGQ